MTALLEEPGACTEPGRAGLGDVGVELRCKVRLLQNAFQEKTVSHGLRPSAATIDTTQLEVVRHAQSESTGAPVIAEEGWAGCDS